MEPDQEEQPVENTIVKTSIPAEFNANLYQDSNPTSAISFRINLTDMGQGSATMRPAQYTTWS